jgi:hypothetical protein
MVSARAVEPRMSTKSMVISTSAPPTWRRAKSSHFRQKWGVRWERPLHRMPKTTAPGPSKGMWQTLQRVPLRNKEKKLRIRYIGTPGFTPVSRLRQNSSSVS